MALTIIIEPAADVPPAELRRHPPDDQAQDQAAAGADASPGPCARCRQMLAEPPITLAQGTYHPRCAELEARDERERAALADRHPMLSTALDGRGRR